jgi:hypothetical protein
MPSYEPERPDHQMTARPLLDDNYPGKITNLLPRMPAV